MADASGSPPSATTDPDAAALRVSVVVPLHDKREHVRAALDSVLAQSRPADEILVVDDGSSDGSGEIARATPGVRYVRQDNAGPGAARNRGIALATGDVVAFLDADDRWTPDKLERQLAFLESRPDVAWCACNHRKVRPDGEARVLHADLGDGWTLHEDWFAAHADRDRMLTSGVLVRREALRASGGFDESIRYGQDGELWTRIALAHPAYGFCGRPLFDYLDVAGSVSKPSRRRLECRERVVELHLERSRRLGHAGYHRYARRKCVAAVRSALSHGESDIARRLARALLANERSARALLYLAAAHAPARTHASLARLRHDSLRPAPPAERLGRR